MLEQLGPAILGSVGGFLSGVLGEVKATRQFKRDMELLKFNSTHELEMFKFNAAEAVREGDRELQKRNWDNLETSMEHDAKLKGVSPWVEDVRAMMRPGITLLSLLLAGIAFSAGLETSPILDDIAIMSTFWWFGSRPFDKTSIKVFDRSDWKRAR